MGQTIAQKIIAAHLVDGKMEPGCEVGLRIDQTLTQDATGTMAYLEYEAMGIPRVRNGAFRRLYRPQHAAKRLYERRRPPFHPHHRQKDRRALLPPGQRHLPSGASGTVRQTRQDAHRLRQPHAYRRAASACLAMGAGGLDVAVAMGGGAYYIPYPKIVDAGKAYRRAAPHGVAPRTSSLRCCVVMSVKGGVGKIVEYGGEGVKNLTVPQRATITNMGAELGATTSIFPSDEVTHAFLEGAGARRGLYAAEPPTRTPCTTRSLRSTFPRWSLWPRARTARINVKPVAQPCHDEGRPGVHRQLHQLQLCGSDDRGRDPEGQNGISRSEPCHCAGQPPGAGNAERATARSPPCWTRARAFWKAPAAPASAWAKAPTPRGVSLRTFNRNFEGRSGTRDAGVYLVSPETAAVSCLTGYITDPTSVPAAASVAMPEAFPINDNMVDLPASEDEYESVEVLRGPNIKPLPVAQPLTDTMELPCLLKVGDNITTDHIMPAGSKILPYRSNIPHLANYCFEVCDPEFPARAMAAEGGFIVGGANYGQGSSREHAALVPLYLGIRAGRHRQLCAHP